MQQYVTTIIIEPRSLVREALVSLMTSHSYQVVGSFALTANMGAVLTISDAPRLVILGALPAEEASRAAGGIRKHWPESKIILLFDHASPTDLQKLLASELDGCIPLFASPETLVGTLQQIIAADLRIMIVKTETSSMPCPAVFTEEGTEPGLNSQRLAASDHPKNHAIDRTHSIRIVHGLSQREEEILKSVVRGHSNKMIARTCGVTDATIKVHMKSILRKIRVANRTQAAIWALERGFGANASSHSPVLGHLEALATA